MSIAHAEPRAWQNYSNKQLRNIQTLTHQDLLETFEAMISQQCQSLRNDTLPQ